MILFKNENKYCTKETQIKHKGFKGYRRGSLGEKEKLAFPVYDFSLNILDFLF
jgi:hypothetical protein